MNVNGVISTRQVLPHPLQQLEHCLHPTLYNISHGHLDTYRHTNNYYIDESSTRINTKIMGLKLVFAGP